VPGKEIGRAGTEAIVLNRIRDNPGPVLGQGGVKLLRAPMHDARLPSPSEQPPSGIVAPMSSVQHPRDPQVLEVIYTHAVVQHRPRLPCVGELVVGHGDSIVKPRPMVIGASRRGR
jgi:hypothetical protein